jgi:HSP20 family protein
MNALVRRRLFRPEPRWAVRDFGDLHRDIDSLFATVFGGGAPETASDWTPHVESWTKDDTVHVRVDLPGIDPKAVDVSVEDDVLTRRGERKSEHDDAAYHEVRYGRFERRLRVPEGTDPAAIKATYANGVLEITIPVPKPETRKLKIDVATA